LAINKRRNPIVGDTILHYEPYFERENEGIVRQVLASQFTYETKDGHIRYCLFREDWKFKENNSGDS